MATIFERTGEKMDDDPQKLQEYRDAQREIAMSEMGRFDLYSISDLYRRFGDISVRNKLALLGYFCGDHIKDIELVERLGRVGADDTKFLPGILKEIVRSMGIATRNLSRVSGDEAKDPYDLGLVEEALIQSVVPEVVSITVSPLELDKKPAWWDSYSANFQRVLRKYISFPS